MKSKKVLSLLILLALTLPLLVSCLASCSDNSGDTGGDKNPEQNSEGGDPAVTAGSEYDSDGFLLDDIPDNLNYNGKKINFLYWEDVENQEFFASELNGNIVNDAIFYRNQIVEDRLGVELGYHCVKGNYSNQAGYINFAMNSIAAGSGEFDILASYSMAGATLAVNGQVQDLIQYDIINLEKPWWPESLINEAIINDRLYFASGDISTNMLHMMFAVIFNKQHIEDYKLEDPYSLVLDGKWTVEKMIEMSKSTYSDLNGNNKEDEEDRFGFVSHYIQYDSFFFAAGLKIMDRDGEGLPIISESFKSEKTGDLILKLIDFIHYTPDACNASSTDASQKIFQSGRAMFNLARVSYAEMYLRDVDFKYGVIPVPKYDEAQSNYYTCTDFQYTLYSISKDSKNSEAAAAVIECLASESYRRVTPAVFEVSMKIKYSNDQQDSAMYDMIREGVSFDLGRIFTMVFDRITYNMFRSSVNKNQPYWASTYASYESQLNAGIKTIVEAFK